tara:strand:+ start:294 stop:893 length:600 start_codon:yes stop_codon:yes gene_type:complete
MEDIEAELESKTIERVEVEDVVEDVEPVAQREVAESLVEDSPPHAVSVTPKKAKKPRSEKQILAFEKARVKRAEGIAARKKQKEEDKIKKKESKKEAKLQDVPVVESQESQVSARGAKPVVNVTAPSNNPREQVIQNHYYYYGVPPPNHDYNEPNKKNKKSSRKRPPTPSSSESESEEEQQHEQQYYEQPKPSYKFGFA